MFGNNQMMTMLLMTKTKKSADDLLNLSLTMEMMGNRKGANMLRKMAMFKKMSDGSLKTPFGGDQSYNFGAIAAHQQSNDTNESLFGDDIAGLGELSDIIIQGDESYNFGGENDSDS